MDNKNYPAESAGRKMIKAVPLCYSEERILDVKNMLFDKMKELETINYIYVINKKEELIGVFSVKEIFRSPEQTKIREIMKKNIIKVRPYADQEKTAISALKNNLKSIPVVDKNNKFLGVVPSDIILDVLYSENVEDFLKMAGINSPLKKILKGSSLYLTKVRIPWLILGLLGGIFAAWIVAFFEEPLRAHFILAAFIPLILYVASAAGTQTETLFIRNLVLDGRLVIKKYLFREIKAGFLMALILGGLFSIISVFWFKASYFIGIALGLSLFLTTLMAIFIGIFIPWLLEKLKKDPAIGTGPFATLLRDILSLVIYFAVASLLLKLF